MLFVLYFTHRFWVDCHLVRAHSWWFSCNGGIRKCFSIWSAEMASFSCLGVKYVRNSLILFNFSKLNNHILDVVNVGGGGMDFEPWVNDISLWGKWRFSWWPYRLVHLEILSLKFLGAYVAWGCITYIGYRGQWRKP